MRRWLLLALALAACETSVPSGAVGASIALLDAHRLAVVDRDTGSVSVLDADTLAPLARVPVGDDPRAILVVPAVAGDHAYVVTRRGGELVELDATPAVTRHARVCAGPVALAQSPAGQLLVACEWDGTLRGVDPTTLAVSTLASGLSAPIAVAQAGPSIFVLESSGTLARVLEGRVTRVTLVPTHDAERPALAQMSAHHPAALALIDDGRSVAVAFELVNPTDDGHGETIVDSYGAVSDGAPKINPALRAFSVGDLSARDTPATYARYDSDASLRCNGPSGLALLPSGELLVTHRSSADLTRLSLYAGRAEDRIHATWHVGAGPAGVAVDANGKVAWVDDALDGAVTRVALDDPSATPLTMIRPLPNVASAAALDGRRTFFDATDPHVSPAGVIACGTCHPDGGSDDLAWFIRAADVVAKLRVPPHLANAPAATAPYHWDGGFPDRVSLVQGTIVDLMAGDGLLVDGASVAAYIDELVPPPVPPAADAAADARGAVVFDRVGCASCHPAPLFTDRQKHAVLPPEPAGPNALSPVDTPGLRGVFERRALLHDGRLGSLEALLDDQSSPSHAVSLSAGDRADLLVYLRSL